MVDSEAEVTEGQAHGLLKHQHGQAALEVSGMKSTLVVENCTFEGTAPALVFASGGARIFSDDPSLQVTPFLHQKVVLLRIHLQDSFTFLE